MLYLLSYFLRIFLGMAVGARARSLKFAVSAFYLSSHGCA